MLRTFDHSIRPTPDPPADANVPDWWRRLADMDPSMRVQEALRHWESAEPVRNKLHRPLDYSHENCQNVELVATHDGYCLIYTVAHNQETATNVGNTSPATTR